MFDLGDLIKSAGSGSGSGSGFDFGFDISSFLPKETGFLMVVGILFIIGLLVALYVFNGLIIRNIGRKAGLEKDWMSFVPFARAIRRLQIVGEEWWKLFFLENSLLYYLIIRWTFDLFNNSTMSTFGNVLAIIYLLGMIAYNLYYRNKYYKAFGLRKELALIIITPPIGFFVMTWIIDCFIAFTDLINYGEAQASKGLGEILHQQPRSNIQSASSGSCSISGLSGMYAGQDIPMAPNDDLVIGRDASFSNIIIDQNADKVSRKHCIVRYDSGRNTYIVTDHSTNGTFIDGGNRLLANMPTPLTRGTVIALGSRENRFKLN